LTANLLIAKAEDLKKNDMKVEVLKTEIEEMQMKIEGSFI